MATILVWLGSGFAFAFGIGVGAWMMRMSSGSKEAISINEKANLALLKRNEIGREQLAILERIASAIESRSGQC